MSKHEYAPVPYNTDNPDDYDYMDMDELYERYRDYSCDENGEWY